MNEGDGGGDDLMRRPPLIDCVVAWIANVSRSFRVCRPFRVLYDGLAVVIGGRKLNVNLLVLS